jgi:hypothetical protein
LLLRITRRQIVAVMQHPVAIDIGRSRKKKERDEYVVNQPGVGNGEIRMNGRVASVLARGSLYAGRTAYPMTPKTASGRRSTGRKK